MDRQELRLVFERGDILLEEWIPTRFRIHAIADEAQTRELCDIFPHARLDVTAVYGGADRHCRGRGHEYDIYQMLELTGGHDQPKMHRYGDLLRAMLADQIAWIENHAHVRRITEQNGRDSLAMAVEATRTRPQKCRVTFFVRTPARTDTISTLPPAALRSPPGALTSSCTFFRVFARKRNLRTKKLAACPDFAVSAAKARVAPSRFRPAPPAQISRRCNLGDPAKPC